VEGRVQSRGEAFWLLLPLWALAAAALRVVPLPKQPGKSRAARIATFAVLIGFPTVLHLGRVYLAGGRFDWTEWLIALYFFAISLEFFLLYVV